MYPFGNIRRMSDALKEVESHKYFSSKFFFFFKQNVDLKLYKVMMVPQQL